MLWMFGSQTGSGFFGGGRRGRSGRVFKNHRNQRLGAAMSGKSKCLYETLSSNATSKSSTSTTGSRRSGWPRRMAIGSQRPTTSVVITITFVVIFTCIITMEVLFIDEDSRLKMLAKTAADQDLVFDQRQMSAVAPKTGKDLLGGGGTGGGQPLPDLQFDQTVPLKQAGRALHQEPDSISASSSGGGTVWLNANQTFSRGDWQPVTGAKAKFYVYSAYLDTRQGRYVRIIGATRTRGNDKVSCVYWYDDSRSGTVIVPASNRVIRENWNLKYSAVFVLCPLFLYNQGRALPVPDEVSVVAGKDHPVGNRLPVLNRNTSSFGSSGSSSGSSGSSSGSSGPSRSSEPIAESGFAVCVKPLHYNFNRALQLVEFIELNLILGVSHFTFYNHTIGREVDCVLRDYVRKGLVTLLPWQLDMASQKEIRTEGLFAAINDCLYRNMFRYRYLLMIDIDEFVVPHRNLTLGAMFQEFDRRINPSKAGSFSFMNSFFYLQWPNDPNDPGLPLVTLQKTKRRSKFHPHKQRSKCILVARAVVEMGNHFVWEFLPGRGAVNVPPEIAFLHHYRVCEFGGNDCVKTQAVTDRTVYRYKAELVRRVRAKIDPNRQEEAEECRGLNVTATSKK